MVPCTYALLSGWKISHLSFFFEQQSPPIPANRSMRALDEGESVSLNVQSAWKAGFTGKGIVVTILDDGKIRMYLWDTIFRQLGL